MTGNAPETATGPAGADEGWKPVSPLSEAIPVRLLRAREAIMQFYRPLFRATGITERQWRVLRSLFDQPFLEPSELAKRAFMQAPNVSRVLSELRTLGYVERVADDGDQRRARVTLTPEGRAATIRVGKAIEARTAELMGVTDPEEFAQLGQLLDMIADLPARHPHLATEPGQPPGP